MESKEVQEDQILDPELIGKSSKELLAAFESKLDKIASTPWSTNDFLDYLGAINDGSAVLLDEILIMGDVSSFKIRENEENSNEDVGDEALSNYVINYKWLDLAKSLLILWRDVFFQGQKAYILHQENKVQSSQLDTLKSQSQTSIQNAIIDLKGFYQKEMNGLTGKSREKFFAWCQRQQDPYPIYKEHLSAIKDQIRHLNDQYVVLRKTSKELLEIKSIINDVLRHSFGVIQQTQDVSQKAINAIEKLEGKTSKIPSILSELEQEISDKDELLDMMHLLDEKVEQLPGKMQVVVNTDHGILQYKEVNFKRNVKQWLESEILPVLFEVKEINDGAKNRLKMSYLNISNQSILMSKENIEKPETQADYKTLTQPLVSFLDKTYDLGQDHASISNLVKQRLAELFGLFSIYDNTAFLPIPLQNSMRQITLDGNKWLEGAQGWFVEQYRKAKNLASTVQREDALSNSEKIVRLIQTRTVDPDINQYSSIFLTKGYVSASFCVGREDEFQHMEDIIDQWKKGFRGAVILSGQRFCGKSLFGDLVIDRSFQKQHIRLTPNALIKMKGRDHKCDYNLGEALEFIHKNTLTDKICLWIDDLEIWHDNQNSLSQNVRKLCTFIDQYSKQIFVMVSMSNWLKSHLDKIHEISKIFQAEINLDWMSRKEIQDAIIVRHGATHKILVDDAGKEASAQFLQRNISKIHKLAEGNIGEALQHWSYAITKVDDEHVACIPKTQFRLPDFLTPDVSLLMATIMMERRTNEYHLNKLFGSPFKQKYRGILLRLQSTGVLIRDIDGNLEVNEVLANDIGKLLEKRQIFNYYHKN